MASNFPKLPGYVPDHDCSIVNHKKISHVKLEKIRNGKNTNVPAYETPTQPAEEFKAPRDIKSLSVTQEKFPNHFGTASAVSKQMEPTYVKLDKQVSALPTSLSPSAAPCSPRFSDRSCHKSVGEASKETVNAVGRAEAAF